MSFYVDKNGVVVEETAGWGRRMRSRRISRRRLLRVGLRRSDCGRIGCGAGEWVCGGACCEYAGCSMKYRSWLIGLVGVVLPAMLIAQQIGLLDARRVSRRGHVMYAAEPQSGEGGEGGGAGAAVQGGGWVSRELAYAEVGAADSDADCAAAGGRE